MVDFHSRHDSSLLKYPINLLFVTPHDIPIIIVSLLPLPTVQALKDAVPEIGLELNIRSTFVIIDTAALGNAPFLCIDESIRTL